MSTEAIKAPNRRVLWLAGVAGIAIACGIAARGVEIRADANRQLVAWTENAAVPSVQLAQVERGEALESLTLPGTIQPFFKAPIYARVSGYVEELAGRHRRAM